MTDLQPGHWVRITVKVVEVRPADGDLSVELFSATDQYTTFVRRDLCTPTDKPIPAEPGVGSVALLGGAAYQRLADDQWYGAGSDEGRTWVQLHREGDVEVIHNA